MTATSATKRSKRSKAYRANRKRLAKAQAVAAIAKRNVAIATKQLTEAVRMLLHAQSGSSKEVRTAKVVRATAKGLVAARKKLRKAEKKQKKAAARLRKAAPRSLVAAAKGHAVRTAKVRHATSRAAKKGRRKPKRVRGTRARRSDGQLAGAPVAAINASGNELASEVVAASMSADSSAQA